MPGKTDGPATVCFFFYGRKSETENFCINNSPLSKIKTEVF